MRSLKFSMLTRVRWWTDLTAFLLLALLLKNVEYCKGAPKAQGHNSRGPQNPFLPPSGPFRVVTEIEDEAESREFSPSRHFHFGSSSTRSQFSGNPSPGAGTSRSFGVPLSAVHSSHQSGSQRITASHSNTRTGTPRLSSSPFTVKIDRSLEDQDADDDLGHSHFSIPGISFKSTKARPISHDFSLEDVSLESMSLGRRFHPHGIPRRSNPPPQQLVRDSSPLSVAAIANPFIFKSNLDSRDSLEDQDDDHNDFVHLSPLVRSHNHNLRGERLSLSNDFMSQYNFVDVKGSVNWGYKTDDQYQDHQVHDDGTMNGNFGWTAPEGAKVSIKYIADKGGYRVVSSSGIYTEEDDDVLLQKAMHFAEHDKAKAKLASVRNSKKSSTAGVPHPPTIGPGFVTVIDDDDDFPLIGRGQGGTGNQATFGVPLPDFDVTFQYGDSSSHPSVPGFGIPLPDSGVTFQSGDPSSPPSGQGFGIPLPDPGATSQSGDPSSPPSRQGFGVPLPDSDITFQSGDPSGPPSGQGFGVPLPDPGVTFQSGDPSVPLSGQGFGVPLPDPGVTFQSGEPSGPPSGQGFGVTLPDPGVTFQSGDPSTSNSEKEFGVPLPESGVTLHSGGPSSPPAGQSFGVPLPDPGVIFQSGDTSSPPSGQGFGVPLPDPGVIYQPRDPSSPPSVQGFGVSLPDPGVIFQSGDPSSPQSGQGFGLPLPDPSVTFQSGDSSSPPSGQGFGVPLPDPGVTFQSGVPPNLPSGQSFGVPLPDPGVALQSGDPSSPPLGQGFGVPLPDPGVALQSGDPSSPPLGQGFGVPLSDLGVTFESQDPSSPPLGQGFGVPLPDPTTSLQSGDQSNSSPGSDLGGSSPDSGTDTADPTFGDQFGINLSNPSPPDSSPNQGFGASSTGVPLPDFSPSAPAAPSQTNQGFDASSTGVPLPDFSPSAPAAPSQTNQGFEFSITDLPSSSAGTDFSIPLSGSTTSSGKGPEESSGHSFGVTLSDVTTNHGFEPQGPETLSPSSHSRPISSHQGFGFTDQANDTPKGSDFGIPLVAVSGTLSGNTGSNTPLGEEGKEIEGSILPSIDTGTFGISLDEIGSSSINPSQGHSLNELPDDNIGFGLGLSSSSTGSSSSGQSFGVPLSSASVSLGKPSGPAATPPQQGSSNFIIVPDDDQLISTPGSPSGVIGSFSPFGAIKEDKIKTEVGLSSPKPSGSFVFSNNEGNSDPASVGVSLSSASSGANQRNSIAESSNSFGVSLANLLSNQYPSNAGDLLQGAPFEELGSSVTGTSEGSTDFNPCLNSKIHPSLLPPECFLSAASAQPDQRIGKSLSQTDSKNEAQDSFIVVVNSDLFQ